MTPLDPWALSHFNKLRESVSENILNTFKLSRMYRRTVRRVPESTASRDSIKTSYSEHNIKLRILVAIAGVVLIARPPFIFGGHDYDENTLVGLIMAFVCSFSIGGIYICLRKIGNSSHYTITSLYYSACGCSMIGIVISLTTGFNFICQVS